MRMYHTVWMEIQPDVSYEAWLSGDRDVRKYLHCDINWENETDYPNKYVDFTFHNKEDELFFRLKWGIQNEKISNN
jgi:hypothetical protein